MSKQRLNIFLLTDVEGIAHVDSIDDVDRDTPRYRDTVQKLCESIHLAVQVCFEAGADRVFYLDGHAGGGNVDEREIDSRALKCTLAEWEALLSAGEIDCMIELGAHARAGTVGGFLDHTLSSKSIFSIKINGVEMSEFSLHAILCAAHGVPTVALLGDEAACLQAQDYVPDIFTGAVKHAEQRNLATTYPDADRILTDTLKTALANRHAVSLIRYTEPLVVEQTFYRTDMCEEALERAPQGTERVDARTLRKIVPSLTCYADLKF